MLLGGSVTPFCLSRRLRFLEIRSWCVFGARLLRDCSVYFGFSFGVVSADALLKNFYCFASVAFQAIYLESVFKV